MESESTTVVSTAAAGEEKSAVEVVPSTQGMTEKTHDAAGEAPKSESETSSESSSSDAEKRDDQREDVSSGDEENSAVAEQNPTAAEHAQSEDKKPAAVFDADKGDVVKEDVVKEAAFSSPEEAPASPLVCLDDEAAKDSDKDEERPLGWEARNEVPELGWGELPPTSEVSQTWGSPSPLVGDEECEAPPSEHSVSAEMSGGESAPISGPAANNAAGGRKNRWRPRYTTDVTAELGFVSCFSFIALFGCI
uniref:Uncharacterized protein n=1 Tax=Plectus sambesii TaxID=2011161 RepID=A0A914UWP7_9BILA